MARSPSHRPTVAVTGVGAVAPNGIGAAAFAAGLREGRSGVGPLAERDPRVRCTVAATCDGFDPESVLSRADLERVPRLVPMALAACREALGMAGVATPLDAQAGVDRAREFGLVLGTGGGGIDFTLTQADAFHHDRRQSLWTITNATHGNLAGELSIRLGLHGASLCVSTGCASSSDAIGLACDLLRSDRPGSPRKMVVVGADAHVRTETLMGMELLGVLATRDWEGAGEDPASASRPFDARRDGFVLGEGAWAVVLERREAGDTDWRERDVARLAGYGATCDAYHRVRPAPDMEESARAMRLAIQDAGWRVEEVGAIQYHGTSTQVNDALETKAVRLALGDHAERVPGSSIKSMIGHPQGACGAAAVVAMIAALRGLDRGPAFIPPTINLQQPDPECDLHYTPGRSVPTDARRVLVNCLAFGAKNSALAIEVR
ncbi:MAG: beta-ketoacyl-[acyl-carrier-protein] synthase family protein [Phycisphaerales bacterium]